VLLIIHGIGTWYCNKAYLQIKFIYVFQVEPIKFWRQKFVSKRKENNLIAFKNLDIYFKNLYDSHNDMGAILNTLVQEDIFYLEDVKFKIKQLANGKSGDIEGYQAEIFKIGRSIPIPHIQKLLNWAVKLGFPEP